MDCSNWRAILDMLNQHSDCDSYYARYYSPVSAEMLLLIETYNNLTASCVIIDKCNYLCMR